MANSNQRVTLVFDADTSKAKASVNELYTTLERLSSMNINNAPGKLLAKDIQEASLAATQLKISLENAINVNTGKLDLNKFNSSLQQSKMSLQDYQRILTSCGPAGQQAFTQLARSVITADASVIRLGDKVRALGVTLANTAKWQISSSIIHGITGAFSTAYNYAKDLNESLNNIRIVTGYSVDSMKDFAAEANKAAKALSTTTTEYSNAALIFYQQGLSSSQVKERVDTVIKLANVTGESASQVSDYMTAIWNNFYDGSQSLEHYADVLTKLGAATASSSDEIAGGLEKFSAIAETIGLSYEYAASALATITAQTRQSEDVVGTALKTIFARIQGLNLGETLEDGVDLNKYSSALKTVGVDVLDASGELKNMDIILDELGDRWDTLSKSQQTALAQTVAGVRQYNQLISLMDNWDDFEINLDLALNADGSLEDQYSIYEESWEAASKRMKNASQNMYDSLINDEAFIKLTDFFTNFIESISASIDSIGGLKGVLLLLGSVLMKVFSPQIGNFLDSIGLKIQKIATGTNQGLNNMKQQATQMLGDSYSASGTFSGGVQAVAAENMGSVNQAYLAQAEKLGAFQKSIAESLLQQQNALNESVIKQGELVKSTEQEYEKRKATLSLSKESLQGGAKVEQEGKDKGKIAYNKVSNKGADAVMQIAQSAGIEGVEKTQVKGKKKGKVLSTAIKVSDEETALKLQTAALEEYTTKMAQAQAIKETFITPMAGLENETANMEALAASLEKFGSSAELSKQDMEELNGIIQSSDFATIESELDKGIQSFDALEATLKKHGKTLEQTFGKSGADAIKQYAQQIKSAKSAQDTMRKSSEKIKDLDEKIAKARTSTAKQKYEKERAEEQKKLTAATQQYNTAVQGSKTAMAGAGEAGNGLRAVFGEVDASMKQLNADAATAKNALLALGYSQSQLDALEQACEDMNVDFAQLVTHLAAAKGGAQNFDDQLNKLAASSRTVGQTLSKIGSVASQVAMGINAISGLGEIWTNEDLTIGEKFTSSLMNLAMILPLVGTAIDAVNKLKNINKINSLAAAGATEAEIAAQMKQMGVTSAETAGLWGKAAAWIAAHPLLAGIGIAAAAAGIAIMVAMTAKEKANTQAVKAAAEAAEKAADASREKAEASQEELNAVKDLHEEYSELYGEYLDSGEVKSDLVDATTDLVNKLGIEEGHLLILQGRYEELNALIEKHLRLKAKENKANADQAASDAADAAHTGLEASSTDKVFINDKASESGHENQYVMGFWDVGANDAWFTEYLTSNYPNGPWEITGDKVVAYYSNPSQIPYLQNQFDAIFQGALNSVGGAGNLTDAQKNGSIYNQYQRGIKNGGDEAASQAWNNVLSAGEQAYVADFEYDLFENNVDDAESYGEVRNAWIEEMVAQAEGDKEAARAYYTNLIDGWASGSEFAEYANKYAATTAQQQNLGANAGKYKTVDDIADQMEKEGYDRDLALQVKIEPWMTEEQINDAIHLAQQVADNNEIQLTVTAAKEGIDALDDVLSVEDYENWWKTYGEQALKGTTYDKNTFAALSPEEQKKILTNQTKLKPASTKQAEADAAKTQAEGNQKAYEDYLEKNKDYYNEDGTRKQTRTKDSYNTTPHQVEGYAMFESNSEWGSYISQDQMKLVGDAITSLTNQTTVTEDSYSQVMTDIMELLNNDSSEEAIAKFDSKYGAGSYERLSSNGQMYALEDTAYWHHDNGYDSTDEDFRKTASFWLQEGNGLDWYNDVNYDKETWNGIDVSKAEEVWAEGDALGLKATSSQGTATRLQEEADAEATVDPYEKEMEYKQRITDLGFDVDEVYDYAEALEEMPLVETREEAQELAVANMRMNKGIDALAGGWEEWGAALKSGNKSSQQYAAALKGVKAAVADVLDTDTDQFTDDFLTSAETLGLLEKVAQGDMEALAELQQKAALNVTGQIKIDTNQTELQGQLDTINSWITDFPDLEIGASLDSTGMTSAFQALLDSGAMTVDQMNAILNNIGFEPEITYKEMTVAEAKAAKQTAYLKTDTGEYTQVTDEVKLQDDAKVWVPVINGKSTSYQGPPKTSLNQKKDSGGGGGGSKKKADNVKKSDVVDRYKEVDDSLDNVSRAMDAAAKAADRLYGKERLDKMREVNKLLEEDIELTKQKRREAEAYLQEDKTALEEAMANAGVTFEFDSETGDITNYTDVMTQLHDQLMAEINAANADGNADEKEQEAIDAIQEKIDKLKEAVGDYEETKETIQDLAQEEIDKFNEWQDNNYELLNIEFELKIKVNDRDLEKLEYYMKKLEGDFYQRAEAGALLGEKAGIYQKQLGDRGDQYEKIMAQWMNKKISDADAMAALEEQLSGIYDDLSSLQETDTEMMNFYGESIALAQEEMSKFTDQMDHQASVLDHYQNILALTGQEFDYESMGVVLEGQAKMAENGMKAAKAEFDFYKKEAEDKKALYEQALAEGNTAAAELYKKEYEDALAAANDAEEKFLSAAENTAEKLKAVLENAMKGFAKDLESALTGGTTFEDLNTQMERAASLQEEYLTTTNKIYETNKVMRKAQQEIDKTTNATAKRKLKSFIQETQQLQDQSKLSKFELEIQQAKYDLLLAEIALEEAQNAKSTVRLQRDSEGNFGYVYTADLSATEDAAQNFADKQNELYNIGLEGANNYKEKYIQTLGEMNDALVELTEKRANGEFATEQEYQEQVLATKEFYYQKLKDYSNLYTTAVGVDAQIVTDSWATQFDTIKLSAKDLEAQVNEYLGNVNTAFNDYNTGLQQITDITIGPNNLEDLTNKTNALVNENDKLLLGIAGEDGKGGLIGAMDEEFNAINSVTEAWAAQRKEVIALIEQYEKLTLGIEEVLDKKSLGGSDSEDTDESKTTPDSSEKKEEEKQDTLPPKPSKSEIQYGTWERVLEVFNNINSGKWPGGLKDRIKTGTAEGYTEEEIKYGQWLIDLTYPTNLGGKGYSRDKAKQIMGFDTGGYTGEWSGAYGKMALLHQKELVLNPQDTENFLTGINILDKIVSTIDLYSMNAQMSGILSSPIFGGLDDGKILEQQVHIEAHFPNVSQHSEIEEAFNNLINTASQYSNRK